MNLPPFYIGETVEYTTGIKMPKGTRVVVTDVWRANCGCWTIAFNGNKRKPEIAKNNTLWNCIVCGNTYSAKLKNYTGWCAKSFRSLIKMPLMTFTQIKEAEKSKPEPEILTLN